MRVRSLVLISSMVVALAACAKGAAKVHHRERFAARDAMCTDPKLPQAFMYPAANRTDYGPDVPSRDGCQLAVPDHLFCCPNAPRPTDE